MSNNVQLPKGYESKQVEERWLGYWEREGTFTPAAAEDRPPFSIVIPPPNVTGSLHMGHALNLTLQDIICRSKRQKGFNVLWVPGTDHAGIATQNVVERSLAAEGKTRQELGREAFVERVWEWKEEYGDKILNQIKRMGASVDWSRQRFTMDQGLSKAVREAFVQLFEQGIVYQGSYIINWCPRCQTALADLEVEHEEIEGGLYHIRYPLADGSGALVVATTRPETLLGDTALAVHPEDERYEHLIGSTAVLPLQNREIPIIGDVYVDTDFGTGCLKVTPAHDPNDFDLGMRHGLESLKVIDDLGSMAPGAGERYQGLDRFECRKRVLSDLKEQGLLVSQESYRHKVGHCYRCQTAIEPLISKQWFVATRELAARAKEAVEKGETQFFPENWIRLYFEWMNNIRDWCISRQIWWGHRIPAWTCTECGEITVSRTDPHQCSHCGSRSIEQEEDVLDTWFSSALWPFSTLGWPERTQDLKVFYPTSVLVTAFDIIFFWVARMMMMGLRLMEEVPFRHVYIHALVRDEDGRKMSKSTGNVIDPLEMIQIYGADALRFTLAVFAAMGRDIKLSEARIQGYRHFINKIWNAARFALMNLDRVPDLDPGAKLSFSHRFILSDLERVKEEVSAGLEEYRFNDAAQELYQFLWHTYCDWYLEMIKPELFSEDQSVRASAQACLHRTLTELLTVLHPFIPFVTQEIWSFLPSIQEPNLARVPFPEPRPERKDEQLARDMAFFQEIVVSVRNIRSELNINPGQKLELLIKASGQQARILEENREVLLQLARLEGLRLDPSLTPPPASASSVVRGCEIYVPLEGIIDFEAESRRMEKQLQKLDKEKAGLERKLDNQDFVNKAPAEVVAKERDRLQELRAKQEKLTQLRQKLQAYLDEVS